MKIHGLMTGTLDIKRFHYRGVGFNQLSRLLMWAIVPGFVNVPVYMWVIEHPDGVIVVDTGEITGVYSPDFFENRSRLFFTKNFRWQIDPMQEANAQLKALGIDARDVKTVILTHAHMDHSDGVNRFPNAKILVSMTEWELVLKHGAFHGCVPTQWSRDLSFKQIDFVPQTVGTFDRSYAVTRDGTVQIVPTPGHTLGHQSVVVTDEDCTFVLAGDTSFNQDLLYSTQVSGVVGSPKALMDTRRRIRDWSQDTPIIYLPSHDFESGKRLTERIIL